MDADILQYFLCGKDSDFLLGHSDLWNNNIFLNDKECVLIDWQCASVGSLTGDIATLIAFGVDFGPEPFKRFQTLVQYYLDFLVECCGDNAALREMITLRVVPVLSSDEMRRKSLQFAVKWILFCWEGLRKGRAFLFTRVMRNVFHILSDFSK